MAQKSLEGTRYSSSVSKKAYATEDAAMKSTSGSELDNGAVPALATAGLVTFQGEGSGQRAGRGAASEKSGVPAVLYRGGGWPWMIRLKRFHSD